jgi:hypothetical protein
MERTVLLEARRQALRNHDDSLFGRCGREYLMQTPMKAAHARPKVPAVRKPRLTTAQRPAVQEAAFARHETFAPRYGWLKKAYDAVENDGAVFTREDAALRLGVGKNMARAIRYWALAFGIVEEIPTASGRASGTLRPSAFGAHLLSERGWDPFLEDLGSLWLLHWNLLSATGIATSWRYAFFEFGLSEFSVDDFVASLAAMVTRQYPTARKANSSLRKDASCIVQMYAGGSLRRVETEETIASPFVQLEIIGRGLAPRHVTFRLGDKPGLSPEIVVALCLDYMNERSQERSASFATLLRGIGSPGLALRLSESSLYAAIEYVTRRTKTLHLSDSAGIIQLSVSEAPSMARDSLLRAHYAEQGDHRRRQ